MKFEKKLDLIIDCLAVLTTILGLSMLSGIGSVLNTALSLMASGIFIMMSISLFKLQEKRLKTRKRMHLVMANNMSHTKLASPIQVSQNIA